MIITYLRSSSLNNWYMCQHQFFLTYVLGLPRKSNKKADKGTIVHKVMECLAKSKLAFQNNPHAESISIEDDAIGLVENISREDFLKPYQLSNTEVETINSTRLNKDTYPVDCKLQYGHIRYGVNTVERLIKLSYDYYVKDSEHDWKPVDFKDCTNWTWMTLDGYGRKFDPRTRKILMPELSFNLKIEKEWAKYELNGIEGNLALKGTIDLVTEIDDKTIEINDYKGLPLETTLPTPSGWTTMQEVKVGDTLYDKDGQETTVIGKSKVKHKECFKIIFDDTSEIECDDEHIWLLTDDREVCINDLKINDCIPVTKPLQCKDIPLPIDPYVLGIWLGDGRNRGGEICNSDIFIFEEIEKRGYKLGKDISSRPDKIADARTVYGLTTNLRLLNLLNNKHIPDIYMRASFAQRLDLLRGLMDSDGYANHIRKQGHFVNCTEQLSKNVKSLLLSLGQRPYLVKTKKRGFGLEVFSYDVWFRPVNINPFLLPRKAEKVKPDWGSGNSWRRKIKQIIPIGKKYTQCIKVDSKTSTFLCGDNMIPTHNTGSRKDWDTNERKDYKKLCNDRQLMLYYYVAKQLFPDKHIILTIYFVRDGGPYSVCFDEQDIPRIEKMIRENFENIKQNKLPKLRDPSQKDFMCNRLCDFYKTKIGKENICKVVHKEIVQLGISNVIKNRTQAGFTPDYYEAPG